MIKHKKNNLEKRIMQKIIKGEIVMKPRWYFALGSLLTSLGLIGASVGAIFLLNVIIFLIRKQGPGIMKLSLMLSTFPWWIPILALLFMLVGIWLLKKYDFSYKKNFWFIVFVFVGAIVTAALLIDKLGLNETWSQRGFGRRFYRQVIPSETPDANLFRGRGGHFRRGR